MTPLQLEAKYHSLPVVIDGLKSTTVNVRRYQNNAESLKENVHWGNKAAWAKKDVLVGRMKAEANKMVANAKLQAKGKATTPTASEEDPVLALAGALTTLDVPEPVKGLIGPGNLAHLAIPDIIKSWIVPMVDVHTGKGSPEQIQMCLHFVAIYRLYDTKKFGADAAAGVRDYCDQYIGLDCNGFTGNFSRETGRSKVPNSQIPYYLPKDKTKRRTKIEDVEPNDVLIWPDFGHIAIFDSLGQPVAGAKGAVTRDGVVVESTAANPSGGAGTVNGGLQHSTYTIVGVKGDLFLVERPKGKGRNWVYIAPLT